MEIEWGSLMEEERKGGGPAVLVIRSGLKEMYR